MEPAAHKQADERAERTRELLRCCRLCPRECGVDRTAGERGYCGLNKSVRCFREMVRDDEEHELNPSHQIYFTGCNMRCEYCTVAEWNEQPWSAEEMDVEDMVARIERRRKEGAKTLNFLGGEPTVNIHGILELLGKIKAEVRVVLNSNMYYTSMVDELMTGLADVYLADMKCGNNRCAESLLDASNYMEIVKQNILKAKKHSDVIIRHVVMPGHNRCCLRPILTWLAKELPEVKLSLRGNYIPPAEAISSPKEYLRPEDLAIALDLAEKMSLRLIQ